jgi:ABC-type antimicrobial peptide transport system, ATPase component
MPDVSNINQHMEQEQIKNITIIGGVNKLGEPENITLKICVGEIISIVGPTGSGKSRLLGDIEWIAQKDTPTKRQILVNGQTPAYSMRFSIEDKLVSQLSQNMNFIMDVSVRAFIEMHAMSRGIDKKSPIINKIIKKANELAGEKFEEETPITSLSGGQSRALMISDTAYLSKSPIVLIDEIENAGIDRRKAIQLLVRNEKIILMATHDPILSLMASKRIVIKNGGIHKIIQTTQKERENLRELEELDHQIMQIRERLRSGELIEHLNEDSIVRK